MPYDSSYMWYLKHKTNEQLDQSQIQKKQTGGFHREGRWGWAEGGEERALRGMDFRVSHGRGCNTQHKDYS